MTLNESSDSGGGFTVPADRKGKPISKKPTPTKLTKRGGKK